MSSAVSKDRAKVFETILSSPGMNEKRKVTLHLSRQHVLLLSRLIEVGLLTSEPVFQDGIIQAFPKETTEDFKVIHEEILKKAELTDFYNRMKSL